MTSLAIPNLLLSDEDLLRRDFDAHVAAGHHDGVGHGDDLVQVLDALVEATRALNLNGPRRLLIGDSDIFFSKQLKLLAGANEGIAQ